MLGDDRLLDDGYELPPDKPLLGSPNSVGHDPDEFDFFRLRRVLVMEGEVVVWETFPVRLK